MPETNPSPSLQKHGSVLTETVRDLHQDDTLDPRIVGAILRKLRDGVNRSTLSIASDPSIDYEEKGRILTVTAMMVEAFEKAYMIPRATGRPQMPALKSR